MAQTIDMSEPRGEPRAPRGIRLAFAAALACWAAGALAFALLPEGLPWRSAPADAVYLAGVAFSLLYATRAALGNRGRGRVFWGLVSAGLLASFVADLGWSGMQDPPFADQGVSYGHVGYLVSYVMFACALLWLVGSTTRRITLITALDAVSVMLSTGVLAWYFLPGRAVSGVAAEPFASWGALSVLSWPLCDAALLFLGLVVLSSAGRPPFARTLVAGFAAFAVADALYLAARTGGSYDASGWPDVFWSLGLILLGLAALASPGEPAAGKARIEPWRVFAFWFGPLSPPVHLAVVLAWGATHPPLPAYVAACGAILFVYLALRVALVSFVTRRLGNEQEETARELEANRVLYELHDTVKQGAHGLSLALRSALEADRRGDRDAARGLLERALKAARETEYRVSKPYDELQALGGSYMSRPGDYLRRRLERFEEYFGVKTHEDLRAPLEGLKPDEIAAVYRIAVEAMWNVAKHAGARNLHLESRRIDDVCLVRLRDDGRGFDPQNPPPGLGLDYMRRRAAEAGAKLDVISAPARGTTVQLRFRAR